MKEIAAVPLDDSGATVFVEIHDEDSGYDLVARPSAELLERAGGSVKASLEKVVLPTARVVFDQLRQLSPDQVEVEFGLKIVARAGAVLASSEMGGHMKVKLIWTSASATVTTDEEDVDEA